MLAGLGPGGNGGRRRAEAGFGSDETNFATWARVPRDFIPNHALS